MLNLKKYYPFFRLCEVSFDSFKQGQYASLDMGFILMAVLRFFIEENSFKEKEVTYPEYVEFMGKCLRRDFGYELPREESKDIADYVFDKIRNDGRPFEFAYYDPAERKRRVSRMRLIESRIRDNTVWYSISADAVEFYLDTKEIKEESRISVQQLLLEKMIRAQNFSGGAQVVERINGEVERLMLKKKDITDLFAVDVFAGLSAYREFFDTGVKWFEDEQRLFRKNKELIQAALARLENESAVRNEKYFSVVEEIYELDSQLKVAMNRHGELLQACMDMQKLTDDVIRRNKLSRLRTHCDYRRMLEQMLREDNTAPMVLMVQAMLKPRIIKRLAPSGIDQCLDYRAGRRTEEKESVVSGEQDITFADEVEDERISHNYGFFAKCIISRLKERESLLLSELHGLWRQEYGDVADRIIRNCDYYSFLVHLCQRSSYDLAGGAGGDDTFLDGILRKELADYDCGRVKGFLVEPVEGENVDIAEGICVGELRLVRIAAE